MEIMTKAIEKRLELNAPLERVWSAISDAAEISRWFSDRCDLDLRPGGRGHFDWDDHGVYSVRVDEVDPPRRLVWSWNHEPGTEVEEGSSTSVEWMLSPREGGGTILELRETGFETEDRRKQNDDGWDEELAELVTMLEAS